MSKFSSILCVAVVGLSASYGFAQTPYPVANSVPVSQIDRAKMETELAYLKKLVADQALDMNILKEAAQGNW